MAAQDENFVLVKMDGCGAGAMIVRVMRTYLSEKRAEQDRELLERGDSVNVYRVIPVEHIDD